MNEFFEYKNWDHYIKDDVSINHVQVAQFGMNLRKSKYESRFEREKSITTTERTTFYN